MNKVELYKNLYEIKRKKVKYAGDPTVLASVLEEEKELKKALGEPVRDEKKVSEGDVPKKKKNSSKELK